MSWNIKAKLKQTDYQKRQQEIIDSLLSNRGLNSKKAIKDFFEPKNPLDLTPQDVGLDPKKLAQAVKFIAEAIQNKQKIVVYGDYDADGICATAILWQALFALGASATPFIPDRKVHGYGLSTKGLKDIIKTHKPSLIITVDNGIVAHQAAKFAKEKNIDLVITDHHQPAKKLPPSKAIVHTDQIAGCAVAWFLARHLVQHASGESTAKKLSSSLLDLACIGTITDLMPMIGINRSFAKFGLTALTHTTRPGLIALKQDANILPNTTITAYHVGFILGPRINAMGRLEQGLDALRLLCTNKQASAQKLAQVLGDTNRTRQELTDELVTKADQIYQQDSGLQDSKIIIIDHPEFHEGVIGLIAGKLSEKYYKPAIIISKGEKISKASARSIRDVNIIELIRTGEAHLINAGGHPGAAGFTIDTSNIEKFREYLIKTAHTTITDDLLKRSLSIDCQLELSDLDLDLYHKLADFEPFGIGNPRPTFSTKAKITDLRTVGSDNSHLKLKLSSQTTNQLIDAIGFGLGERSEDLQTDGTVNLAFTLNKNEWNNQTTLQLILKDFKDDQTITKL